MFKNANTGEFLSVSEARRYLEGLEAEGHTVLPSSGKIGDRGSAQPERNYQIDERPLPLGGGYCLRLIEDGEEMGGGVFPLEEHRTAREQTDAEVATWAYKAALAEAHAWVGLD